MFKDFKDYSFNVIDVTIQGAPEMFININGITFSRKAVEDMGSPQFVRPLIDAENKVFAIQACKQNDDKAIKFGKPTGEKNTAIIVSSQPLMRVLRTLMVDVWKDNSRYKMLGRYFSDAKAMVFDLNTAEATAPYRQLKSK